MTASKPSKPSHSPPGANTRFPDPVPGASGAATPARRFYPLFGVALAFGMTITLSCANAIPALVTGDYSNSGVLAGSGGVAQAYGAMNGPINSATANTVPGQGGLCQQSNLAAGCISLAPNSAGNVGVQTGLVGVLANYNGTIPITPAMLASGDNNLDLTITVSDILVGKNTGSYYEITLDGNYLGETCIVSVNCVPNTLKSSTGTFSVVLNDGNLANPATEYLGITNGYFANTGSPAFQGSELSLTVTETDVPEPASLGIFAAGLGLMGLLRRYRAGVCPGV